MDNQRYFLNPESVSKHLYCSICQDVFHEPQRAPCGHSFCKTCILTWLKQSKSCPEDRSTVTVKALHYDFILANIIGDQMVACPFRNKGCEYVDKLERLSNHKKECAFNPKNLPDFMRDDAHGNLPLTKDIDSDYDGDKLPTPAKPSLKMRLFRDENKRELLRSVFEANGNNRTTSKSNANNKENVLLEEGNKISTDQRTRVILIDDSF